MMRAALLSVLGALAFVPACSVSVENQGGGDAKDGGSDAPPNNVAPDGATGDDGGQSDGSSTTCVGDLQSDAKNCGACGHDCGAAACTAGLCAPTEVAKGSAAGAIAVDATNVYWLGYDTANKMIVAAAPKAGGAVTTLATAPAGEQWLKDALVVEKGAVYWTVYGHTGFRSVPTSGGAITTVFDKPSGDDIAGSLFTVRGSHLYFSYNCETMYRIALPSGEPEELYSEGCNSFTDKGLVVDASETYAYLLSNDKSSLFQVATADPHDVTPRAAQGDALAIDATSLYWTTTSTCTGQGFDAECSGATIQASAFADTSAKSVGGAVVGPGPNGSYSPNMTKLLSDGKTVYVENHSVQGDNGIRSLVTAVPIGKSAFPIWRGKGLESGMAMDDAFIYVADSDGQRIIRIAK
jgi:hypothetical protein